MCCTLGPADSSCDPLNVLGLTETGSIIGLAGFDYAVSEFRKQIASYASAKLWRQLAAKRCIHFREALSPALPANVQTIQGFKQRLHERTSEEFEILVEAWSASSQTQRKIW